MITEDKDKEICYIIEEFNKNFNAELNKICFLPSFLTLINH